MTHHEATKAEDPFAKLDEYARWGGPNSTYQWALDEIIRLREHIAITIETLTRGDEFSMLEDGSNPLQSCIDRLKGAL